MVCDVSIRGLGNQSVHTKPTLFTVLQDLTAGVPAGVAFLRVPEVFVEFFIEVGVNESNLTMRQRDVGTVAVEYHTLGGFDEHFFRSCRLRRPSSARSRLTSLAISLKDIFSATANELSCDISIRVSAMLISSIF